MNKLSIHTSSMAVGMLVLAACGTAASVVPSPLPTSGDAGVGDAGIGDAQAANVDADASLKPRTIRGTARTVSGAPPTGAIVHFGKMKAIVNAKGEFELADAWPATDATYDLVVACFAPESGQSERPCEGTEGSKYDGSLNVYRGLSSNDVWAALDNDGGGLFHWDGRDWLPVPLVTDYRIPAVWGASSNRVWLSAYEPASKEFRLWETSY
jgi:hypothetical protein